MTLALVDDLADATARLRKAMQESDLATIEAATMRFAASLEAIRGIDAWRADPAIKMRIRDLIGELESSRMMACLLADMTGQMHGALASRHLDVQQPLYQRARHG